MKSGQSSNLIRRFPRLALGKIAVGATALVSLAYLVLVVINWSDQPPSETTIRFSSLYADRPNPADSNNAYTYMLAFSSPPDADPYELGLRRQTWIQSAFDSPGLDVGADPLSEQYDYRSERTPAVTNLAQACNRQLFTECIEALIDSESVVSEWLDSEAWLLDRYIEMIALTGYREATPYDHGLPLPPYSDISDIQRLLFIRAWAAGESGNADLVESLLQQDLNFWRMLVANSDLLITKMIATGSVISHFRMGNLIVRHLQRGGLDVRMPSSWLVEISDSERSMQRSLIGEWLLMDRTLKQTGNDAQMAALAVWDYVFWKAISPFWQPQDLSNRHAEGMMRYIDLFAAPYDSIPDAIAQARQMPSPYSRPFSRAYNLTGDYLFASVFSAMSNYGARVADLEGVRRAAVAAWRLRAEGVALDDMDSRLRERQWANPYTNTPLEWDSSTNEVVFHGQQSGDRGRYAFAY